MEAVSLAPTAVNQQKFLFELKNGKVTANRKIPVGAKITVWVDTLDGSMRTSDPYIITVD